MLDSKGRILAALLLAVALAGPGCKSVETKPEAPPSPPALRVAVSPDFPPMIFSLKGGITGVEADFARLVGQALGRPVTFVPVRWDGLIPAILEGRADIVMSGMSVTVARQMRVDFTDPYFESGIVAAMRAEDKGRFFSRETILQTAGNVGVIPGTTADAFFQRNFRQARRIAVAKAEHAALELKNKRIDLFLADMPAVVWLVSSNEADLAGYWKPLSEEKLAWAVGRDNPGLRADLNRLLAQWKEDGTVDRVLHRWLPYLERIDR